MTGIISVNVKKIKATARVNSLIGENYREDKNAKKYDDGHRIIDTGKTRENVFLLERPGNYDAFRKERINRVNNARSERSNTKLHLKNVKEKLRTEGTLQAEASREVAATRKLRSDTVDTLGLVIQPSADFINALDRDGQTQFFRDSLEVMQAYPDWFGKIETAVIHYDENTPHMQCLATTINEETLTSDAKRIVGNKTKMSDRQTLLANEMKVRGWDIERGIKRVNNPEYRNFKSEMEQQGYKVTRYNDAKLMREYEAIKQSKLENKAKAVSLDKREKAVAGKELLLDGREQTIARKELILGKKEKEYNTKKGSLDNAEKMLSARESFLDARAKKLDGYKASLDDDYNRRVALLNAQIQKKNKELEDSAREIRKRENKAKEIEADLSAREKALKAREKSFSDSKRKAVGELQGMASYVKSMTMEQLKALQQNLSKTEDTSDFEEQVRLISNAGTRSAVL